MYHKLADKLANILILLAEKEVANNKSKDVEVISYGIELLLSSVVNLILVLMIGTYFFGILKTIAFILVFCPLRQFSGGFHANSYLGCSIGFLVLFLGIGSVIQFIEYGWICFLICIVLICFILFISPIDTENKRLDHGLREKCKKRIRLILGIELITVVILFSLGQTEFLQIAVAALSVESFLLGLGQIVNRRRDKYVDCNV